MLRPLSVMLCFFAVVSGGRAFAAERPRLVVNIVVSQLRPEYLDRYAEGLGEGGFRRFLREGAVFTQSYYNYMLTTTEAALATLTTGSDPSTHGITSRRWIDYVNGSSVDLVSDPGAIGLECDAGVGQCSPRHLTVPTLGDRLVDEVPGSRMVTVAVDPYSAVVFGGRRGDVYWLDAGRGSWISSTAYRKSLPSWLIRYERNRPVQALLEEPWTLLYAPDRYRSEVCTRSDLDSEGNFRRLPALSGTVRRELPGHFDRLAHPGANTAVAELAKQIVVYEELGCDRIPDLLNLCFDAPRYAGERYGDRSLEYEDMLYHLDAVLDDLMTFVEAQFPDRRVLWVLTSDHGASNAPDDENDPFDRFNTDQFKVIVNSFLVAQWGPGDWVLDYVDRQLYLNRTLIYTRGLSLEEVQNRTAAFVLQFRGVSHVLTSTAMQNSFFGSSYAQKMQNSFYPKRSGDLTINLMPGWIEEDGPVRSSSGSMYDYDAHVPLVFLGCGVPRLRSEREVDMRCVAPTLARILQIGRPIASTGTPLVELTQYSGDYE